MINFLNGILIHNSKTSDLCHAQKIPLNKNLKKDITKPQIMMQDNNLVHKIAVRRSNCGSKSI